MRVEELSDTRPAGAEFARMAALAGMLAIVMATLLIVALHVLPPSSQVDSLHRTISEYALLDIGWVFDLALVLLAAGSIAVLVALTAGQVVRQVSAGSACMLLWSICLLVLVLSPKHNWAIGPSLHGQIHRVASLLAFFALPIGAMLIARTWRGYIPWRAHASWSFWLGATTLLWFLPIIAAVTLYPVTGTPWWHAIPLGLVERLLALNAVATVLALGWWGVRAARHDHLVNTHSALLQRTDGRNAHPYANQE